MGGKRHGGQKTGGQKAGGQKAWGAKGRGAKDRGAKDRGGKDRGAKDRGAKVLEPKMTIDLLLQEVGVSPSHKMQRHLIWCIAAQRRRCNEEGLS